MKNTFILLGLILLSATAGMAQKKAFTVNTKFEKVIDFVGEFQSKITKGEALDAAMGDKTFSTDITIKNEKYGAQAINNYLSLAYKKEKVAATITSVWAIELKQLTPNTTQVSVSLTKVTPGATVKTKIDVPKTISSGKLEKDLQDFLSKKK